MSRAAYARLVALACTYCGGVLNPSGVGLDRVDSTLGYTASNVLPCCRDCNALKARHTEAFFRRMLEKFGASGEVLEARIEQARDQSAPQPDDDEIVPVTLANWEQIKTR